jgi:hypothetical protein
VIRLTAPSSKALTVLHVLNPDAPWVDDKAGGGSTTGSTRCGQAMLTSESWQLLEQLPGESICPKCLDPLAAGHEQETLC